MLKRAAALAALLVLGGCGDGAKTAGPQDQYAGLDADILKWRGEIASSDALCQSQAAGEKCDSFEVACKAQRTITPEDQAKGVTAKLVAAMDWNGWDPKLKQAQRGSKAALFTKAGGAWTHTAHGTVNLTSCADM